MFKSGMAAAATVLHRLPTGSTLALPTDPYHGVNGLAERVRLRDDGKFGVSTRMILIHGLMRVLPLISFGLRLQQTHLLMSLTHLRCVPHHVVKEQYLLLIVRLRHRYANYHLTSAQILLAHSATKFLRRTFRPLSVP